jgi:SHS2 domain-containing protein
VYELFEHTADLGLRAAAPTLEKLLVEAAHGLLAILVANPDAVRPLQSRTITLTAQQPPYLLFDWLTELLYAFETEKLLLAKFDLKIANGELTATCRGEPMDPARHQMEHEIKAITYHRLRAEQKSDKSWFAEVIVDI